MEKEQQHQIRSLADMLFRRKGLICGGLLLGLSLGFCLYLYQPRIYEASALLSYQQQAVNPARMSPDVEARIKDIVSTLTQIVLSRNSLERIIEDADLYQKQLENLPMDDVIESMRRKIAIEPSRQGDTFTISFMGPDPKKVLRVTNALSARFIEENLKYREEKASETSAYTQDELDMTKEMLDQKEAVMRDYKLKHYNEMPDQQVSNMNRLIALQEQYQAKQESIQNLEHTRVLIREQIAARKQYLEAQRLALIEAGESQRLAVESDAAMLARMKAAREILLDKYKAQHPQIRSLDRRIATTEKKLAEELEKSGGKSRGTDQSFDQELFDLEIQLKEITLSIESITRERKEMKENIADVEKWVAAAPIREAEWSSLTREYGELKRHYDFLVSQNLQARSALNLERKQKGSQFKIEDPARLPTTPVKPRFLKLMFIGLVAGGAMGGGTALLLQFFDTTMRSPEAVERRLGVEVICAVPRVALKKEILRRRLVTAGGSLVALCWTAALIAAIVYAYTVGRVVL